jgi:hypothetical protein
MIAQAQHALTSDVVHVAMNCYPAALNFENKMGSNIRDLTSSRSF